MDTLIIVRKIREAEALADAGKHGDARRLLEPLLDEDGLTDNHRKLVGKKIDLFKKQHERMTRIISRRATGVSVRNDESNASSERTAIRKPIGNDRSERPTDHTPDKEDATERPTNRTIETQAHGAPTEVVPRARNVDTEVPEQGHKLKVERSSKQTSGMWSAVGERREVVRPPAPSDSQELAPVVESDRLQAVGESGDEDPRATDIFVVPPEPVTARDSTIRTRSDRWPAKVETDAPDDDSAPVISRYNVDRPVVPSGNDTPAPAWNDTPVPSSVTPRPPVRVRDSVVLPEADTVMVPAVPDKHDDSTYIMADDYFNSRPSARQRERSNPELKALADRLPDDDLRRELALEVVKLREELENVKSGRTEVRNREGTRVGSRKIQREDRPESGSFHIPASQVNTIVRRAAGTDQIEVHMPGRDDDASDLQVLRKDSVRGAKASATPTDRIALAQDYIEAGQIEKPGMLKPLATWLGVLVVLGVIGWGVHLGYRSVTGANRTIELTGQGVGEYTLGAPKKQYNDGDRADVVSSSFLRDKARKWLIQYGGENDEVTSVAIPGPDLVDPADSEFDELRINWDGATYSFADGAGIEAIKARFGEATPPFSKTVWDESENYTLRYVTDSAALEFCYDTKHPSAPLWVRLVTGKSPPAAPTADDFKDFKP